MDIFDNTTCDNPKRMTFRVPHDTDYAEVTCFVCPIKVHVSEDVLYVWSLGPDEAPDFDPKGAKGVRPVEFEYNPTNGAASKGDIIKVVSLEQGTWEVN